MRNKYLKSLIIFFVVITILMYAAFSFANMALSPIAWGYNARIGYIFLVSESCIIWLYLSAILSE